MGIPLTMIEAHTLTYIEDNPGCTATGLIYLSKAHKLYDTIDIAKTMEHLKKECTAEEIESFYKVLDVYNQVIRKDFEINAGHRSEKDAK